MKYCKGSFFIACTLWEYATKHDMRQQRNWLKLRNLLPNELKYIDAT